MVGDGYFRTLKTPLLAGREFNEHDVETLSEVAVVNKKFARELTGGMEAVGRSFWIEPTPYEPQTAYKIVGVVRNTKYRDLREDFQPIMFLPPFKAGVERPGIRLR